jgi:hypothetical protein
MCTVRFKKSGPKINNHKQKIKNLQKLKKEL